MSLRKATFSLTADAAGFATADVKVSPVASARPGRILYVELTEFSGGAPQVTLYEINYDADLVADYGSQLYFSPNLASTFREFPQGDAVVTDAGVAVSSGETGDVYVDTTHCRCDVDGLNASGTATVTVMFETGGDFRF